MQFEISFFIKKHIQFWPRFFIFKFDLNVKHTLVFFVMTVMWFFFALLNYTLCTNDVHVIWVDEVVLVEISIKKINKS